MREVSLQIDPIACDGHGVCAELFPERVELDDWGYPVVDPAPIDQALMPHARRAVTNCPAIALRLERVVASRPSVPPGREQKPIQVQVTSPGA